VEHNRFSKDVGLQVKRVDDEVRAGQYSGDEKRDDDRRG